MNGRSSNQRLFRSFILMCSLCYLADDTDYNNAAYYHDAEATTATATDDGCALGRNAFRRLHGASRHTLWLARLTLMAHTRRRRENPTFEPRCTGFFFGLIASILKPRAGARVPACEPIAVYTVCACACACGGGGKRTALRVQIMRHLRTSCCRPNRILSFFII